jgi:hypothetical protein
LVDHFLSFCSFSFDHYVVCPSSTYVFWLSIWHLQILLPTEQLNNCMPIHSMKTTSFSKALVIRLIQLSFSSPWKPWTMNTVLSWPLKWAVLRDFVSRHILLMGFWRVCKWNKVPIWSGDNGNLPSALIYGNALLKQSISL